MVPRPVKAVVLLFPISELSENKRKEEDEKVKQEGQSLVDPTIFWIKQTVHATSSRSMAYLIKYVHS